MENSFFDEILNVIAFLVITAILISFSIFIVDDINANAQESDTVILEAGTYTFNENLIYYLADDVQIPLPMQIVMSFQGNTATTTVSNIFFSTLSDGTRQFKVVVTDITPNFGVNTPISINLADDSDWNYINSQREFTILQDVYVLYTVRDWIADNSNYNEVNGNSAITNPYINVDIPTDIQIMENINMDINCFGSTISNDNVGITALNGDTLGRLRTNDGTLISFNGIAVTSFDSWRTTSTYVYPLTDDVIATSPFTISNGLMLYVWDDTQYYQVAWYNPSDGLWYVHGDYAIVVPYGHRSTTSIGTLTDGIALSMSITPNLTVDDLGYVELGGFEDTPPYDNIITTADEDAYSTFAMFCNANFISDSEKLSWGIAQHQSGQNLGQSQQLGDNILGQFLQAPIDILDSIVIYTTPNGTSVTLMGVFGALLTLSLVIIFLKLFAGG